MEIPQRKDHLTQFVVNGKTYNSIDEIEDPETRELMRDAQDGSLDHHKGEIIDGGTTHLTQFVVNGKTYNSIDEIEDPALRELMRDSQDGRLDNHHGKLTSDGSVEVMLGGGGFLQTLRNLFRSK